ncbi:hypothetical protein LMH87_005900 [Akanthomyces muscarius]|uniref:Uncharacterized protein n=1 Tax=Akanthomyces muscarius TaxID=2231603 RepID=A0A9W8QPV6_AKAMU|nr:hypothetical protein LMH87_005900 [Akanthomyces muscarius]KAJ4164217.1 hypothetical protein LMH87_005900 [Akanthomyces muscarius]
MVRILAVVAAVAVVVAPAAAANCKPGLRYCGYVLIQTGLYYDQIVEALEKVGSPVDADHVLQSLFFCDGGKHGDIHQIEYCSNICRNGGANNNDYCKA